MCSYLVLLTFCSLSFKRRNKPEWEHIKLWIELTAENVVPKFYVPHQYIVKQGDIGTELFILKSGKVSVLIEIDGKEKEVATLGPGAYFGDLSLLGLTNCRSASIQALSQCTVFMVLQENFEEILKRLPDEGVWLRSLMLDVAKTYQR